MLFLLGEKFVSTSQNEEFVKKTFLLKLDGIQFFKKFLLAEDYFCKWTIDFLASGNHFLPFSQTAAANGSSLFFNWNIFFSQSFIPSSEIKFFVEMENGKKKGGYY